MGLRHPYFTQERYPVGYQVKEILEFELKNQASMHRSEEALGSSPKDQDSKVTTNFRDGGGGRVHRTKRLKAGGESCRTKSKLFDQSHQPGWKHLCKTTQKMSTNWCVSGILEAPSESLLIDLAFEKIEEIKP